MRGPARILFAGAAAAIGLMVAAGPSGAATISSSTATPLVDNFADDSVCSLREMIQIANLNDGSVEGDCTVGGDPLGDDTIQLGNGTYAVSINEDVSPDNNAQGDLDIGGMGSLMIDGAGIANTRISETIGMPTVRVMEVTSASLTLQELIVSSGIPTAPGDGADGGGVFMGGAGTLNLNQVDMNTNGTGAGGDGGAVAATSPNGTVNVTSSVISSNTASTAGGGISALGNLSVTFSGISTNTAGSFGGGIRKDGFAFSFTDSSLIDNHVTGGDGFGGGLRLQDDATTTPTITARTSATTTPSRRVEASTRPPSRAARWRSRTRRSMTTRRPTPPTTSQAVASASTTGPQPSTRPSSSPTRRGTRA